MKKDIEICLWRENEVFIWRVGLLGQGVGLFPFQIHEYTFEVDLVSLLMCVVYVCVLCSAVVPSPRGSR